jgi:hypothetical protein
MVLVVCLLGCPAGEDKKAENKSPAAPAAPELKVPEMPKIPDIELTSQKVEVGCGMCMFKMEGVQGCKLAAKVNDQAFLVSGADVDAHTAGLCHKTAQATISGKVEEGELVAADFELLP